MRLGLAVALAAALGAAEGVARAAGRAHTPAGRAHTPVAPRARAGARARTVLQLRREAVASRAPTASEVHTATESARLQSARARLQRALDEVEGIVQPDATQWVPNPQYDPAKAEARFRMKPGLVIWRQMQLLAPLLRFIVRVMLDQQMGNEVKNRRRRAAELRDVISSLGPAIIKAGQALSSRSDLLPAEYLLELSKLQDRIPPFATEQAMEILEAELGRPIGECYATVDDTPVAAASLGQVYKARLLDGTPVAIKIQRPGAEPTIALDLYILRTYSRTLTTLIALLGRQIDLVSVIDDFGKLIYSEIDYAIEAASARRFLSLYGSIPNVTAPQTFPTLSTHKVLTMEWIDGVRLTNRSALLQLGLEPSRLVDSLVQCTLRQILRNGFFHADPHGGNLLVTADGQLAYIDFGMMSFVEPHQRYAIIEAVVHMVNRDFYALAKLYKVLGFIPPDEDIQPIASALNRALPDVLNSSVAEFNFKSVVDKLGDVMYTYPFSLPPFYIAVIRCLGVLEGVALQVDQDFAIIKDAYPFVASRLLTDRSPQLQSALKQLIFTEGEVRWSYLEELLENAVQTPDYDVVAALEQLSEYLFSDEGELLLTALSARLVDEIDALSADSAIFLYSSVVSLTRQIEQQARKTPTTSKNEPPRSSWGVEEVDVLKTGMFREELEIGDKTARTASGSQNQKAPVGEETILEAALVMLTATITAVGSGEWDHVAGSVEQARLEFTNEQMSPTMRRAMHWIKLMQGSSVSSLDRAKLSRFLGVLLSQQKVQQQLVDISLQLFERAMLRGIRALFDSGQREVTKEGL